MTHTEALKLALEALGKWSSGCDMDAVTLNDLIATLEAALEQPEPPPEAQTEAEKIAYCAGWWAAMAAKAKEQPEQEPYCYVYEYDSAFGLHREFYPGPYNGKQHPDRTVPVYTHPPRREQEEKPVAWMFDWDVYDPTNLGPDFSQTKPNDGKTWTPLYTHPPRREWQGLTAQEIHNMPTYQETREMYRLARAIEQALKEKNHE